MALSAYESFANENLVFPIGGKNYELKPVSIPNGIILQGLIAGKDEDLAEAPTSELWKLVLGDLYEEFIKDGVSAAALARAGLAAIAEYQYGRQTAIAAWEAGADPKALADYMERKFPTNRASRRSTSTGGAKKTPSRASTKGTTSPVK
jgi:hypothetical protein